MTFEWFKIFNLDEWEATGLSSRSLALDLEGRGETEIHIVRGFRTCINFDGVLLPVGGIEGEDSRYIGIEGQYAVFIDSAQDVYLGFLIEEDVA